jgi:hypothetical protein
MTAVPIAYGHLGQLPVSTCQSLERIDQVRAPGLRLYERFVRADRSNVPAAEPARPMRSVLQFQLR